MTDNTVRFKKGDIIARDSDKDANLLVIRSGHVAVTAMRGKNQIELARVGQGQIIGERAITGPSTSSGLVYVAASDVEALIVPAVAARQQAETAPQIIKLILKSLSDRQSAYLSHMKEILADTDQRPCPEEAVPHVFGAIFLFSKIRGKPAEGQPTHIEVEWNALKQYSQRILMVPPTRLESALKVLKKIDLVELHFQVVEDLKTKKILEKNPNIDPDELPKELYKITLKEPEAIERFFEFYQNTYYKAMNPDALKVEEKLILYVRQLVRLSDTQFKPDRAGIARIDFKAMTEAVQAAMGPSSVDYFAMMESKGLFAKRENTPQGTFVAIYVSDFRDAMRNWSILRELEKWNEKGTVEMAEEKKGGPAGNPDECAACKSPLQAAHKFCPACGTPRTATAKAA